MNKKTKAIVGFTIGAIIGTGYSLYELYKYVDEIETQNVKLKADLWEANFNNILLQSNYITLHDNMTVEEREQFHRNFPFSIPSFIEL